MKIKNIMSIFIGLTILFTSVNFINADNDQNFYTYNSKNYTSVVFSDLDAEGTDFINKIPKEIEAKFTNISIQNDSVKIKGYGIYDNKEKKSFNLEGQLKNSENTNNLLVGSLRDISDNFDVIYFGISANSNDVLSIGKKANKFKENSKYLFCLYLREKSTRNLTIVEIVDPEFINIKKVFENSYKLDKCEHIDQFWYAKILKPVKVEENSLDSTEESLSEIRNLKNNNEIAAKSFDTTYTYTYNVSGASVTESFVVRHYTDGPSEMYGQGSFVSKLIVVSEETTCDTIPSLNSDDTNFSIGVYEDTKIDSYTSPGDYFQQVIWDGKYYQPGTISLNLGWNYSLPKTRFGFSVSYSSSKTYTNHTYKSFDNSDTNKVRQAGIRWKKSKQQLRDKGNNFDQSFTINKLSDPGIKYFKAKFTYDISNAQDYTYGGTKTKTVSLSYNCK